MLEVDQLWLALLGLAVVAFAMFDVVATTLAVGAGRGPLTDLLARAIGWLGHAGRTSHRRLRAVGVIGAVSVPAAWVLLLWSGFALMFLSDDDAVVVAASQEPTTALGRVAFAAGGLAGAGAGLTAGTETWQLVNNVSALVGLAVVTLGLTYLFQVVTSVNGERATASQIAGLGPSPSQTVASALRAPDLGTLPTQLTTIADKVSVAAQAHLALPLLQFFHSGDRDTSVAVNLARYDEVLSLLEHAVDAPLDPTIASGRAAVDSFIDTLRLRERSERTPPPAPPLSALREVSDRVPDDTEFARRLAGESERRRRLLGFVEHELWSWDDVVAGDARA